VVDLDGPRAVFELTGGTSDQDVLKAALGKGAVRSFTPVLPSLEEIFKEAI
jgi:ABC-2 type transport system ATP-binding protein